MHQTLSGHFSLRTSRETGPTSGGSFSCPSSSNFDLRAGPRPEGPLLLGVPRSKGFFSPRHHPSWDLFRDVFGWAHYSNEAKLAALPGQLRNHTQELWTLWNWGEKKKKGRGGGRIPASSAPTRLRDLKVNSSNPSEWRTAVTAKLPHLTHTRHVTGRSTGLV